MIQQNDRGRVGNTISHYRILNKIDGGGQGIVYKAEDTKLHRTVALKFLPPELTSDKEAKERFIREAQSASTLDHQNICNIHEIGETEDGSSFIAMACYDGETLKDKIKHGPLRIEEAIDISLQIAHGLACAHDAGIIHRDIKPANIMITHDGTVKILDFGLAKLLYETKITESGTTLGTVAYMSPEQLKGDKLDKRTDIWSLGVVLYEKLTGQLPFKGEQQLAISYSIVNENAEPVSKHRRGIPKELETLIDQCLQKTRELRPHSAHDFIKVLEGKAKKYSALASKRILIYTSLAVLISVIVFIMLIKPPPKIIDPPKAENYVVAIISFRISADDSSKFRWPDILRSIITSELSNIDHIAVTDPWSLKGLLASTFGNVSPPPNDQLYTTLMENGMTKLIDGHIVQKENEFIINASLIDVKSAKVLLYMRKSVRMEDELYEAAQYFSREIIDYLNIHSDIRTITDLEPWKKGTRNLEAIKAFESASDYVYKGKLGGEIYLREALVLDSAYIAPRIWLISALAQTGRQEEAWDHYRFLLRLKPRAGPFEKAMIEWCDAFLRCDKKLQIGALQSALQYSPSNNILLANLAEVRYYLGEYQTALDALLPIVKMRWNYGPIYALVGKCYIKRGDYKEARRHLENSLNIPEPCGSTYALLAALSLRDGDTVQADKYTSKALAAYNERKYTWEQINEYVGADYLTVKCWKEAIDYFRKGLDINPNSASLHGSLADAFSGTGNWKEALKEYHQALDLDSSLSELHYSIGMISDSKGIVRDAIDHYNIFLSYDSISINALTAMKRKEFLRSVLKIK